MTSISTAAGEPSDADLEGLSRVDFMSNVRLAISSGRRMPGLVREVLSLMRGPGKISPHEYFLLPSVGRKSDRRCEERFHGETCPGGNAPRLQRWGLAGRRGGQQGE